MKQVSLYIPKDKKVSDFLREVGVVYQNKMQLPQRKSKKELIQEGIHKITVKLNYYDYKLAFKERNRKKYYSSFLLTQNRNGFSESEINEMQYKLDEFIKQCADPILFYLDLFDYFYILRDEIRLLKTNDALKKRMLAIFRRMKEISPAKFNYRIQECIESNVYLIKTCACYATTLKGFLFIFDDEELVKDIPVKYNELVKVIEEGEKEYYAHKDFYDNLKFGSYVDMTQDKW